MAIDYSKIPERTLESLRAYVEHGRPLGSFCEAVVTNDLRAAVGRADEGNLQALLEIVAWLMFEAPMEIWGTPEAYRQWVEMKRFEREQEASA